MINIAELRALIEYDPATGELRWLARPEEMFPRRRSWLAWNTRYAGRLALNAPDTHGYRSGRIFDRKYYAHRVAMALLLGEWPDEVDHISGDVTNNSAKNLRVVTHRQNMKNLKRATNNTSGVTGVYWDARAEKWCAQIAISGRRNKNLGQFDTKADAALARKRAEGILGYHENHGRTAP